MLMVLENDRCDILLIFFSWSLYNFSRVNDLTVLDNIVLTLTIIEAQTVNMQSAEQSY